MTQEHPITPPPELIAQIRREALHKSEGQLDYELRLIHDAYRAGADQELEACCERLVHYYNYPEGGNLLRAARRPKPPSLKEQALKELELLRGDANTHGLGFDTPAIRRALEALPD